MLSVEMEFPPWLKPKRHFPLVSVHAETGRREIHSTEQHQPVDFGLHADGSVNLP